MNKFKLLLFLSLILLTAAVIFVFKANTSIQDKLYITDNGNITIEIDKEDSNLHELSIESLKNGKYPGSNITIEQTLTSGVNYRRYIASYKSEGLKIYALLTIPNGNKPEKGWPVILFNHGYVPPSEYKTTERYLAYTDVFSRNGYIVFRSDYRGHGTSEGQASGGYGSNGYTIDILNAISTIKKYPDADPNRIGMWGHSLGGFITLRTMVVSQDIKAGVIWAGVVASYEDLLTNWRGRIGTSSPQPTRAQRSWRQNLIDKYGNPQQNPAFWNSLSANSYLTNILAPIQLHHGTGDTSVPVNFSEKLKGQLLAAGKVVELYTYPFDDHNITNNLSIALQRSIDFFNKYLK